jgi:hypothetical protein
MVVAPLVVAPLPEEMVAPLGHHEEIVVAPSVVAPSVVAPLGHHEEIVVAPPLPAARPPPAVPRTLAEAFGPMTEIEMHRVRMAVSITETMARNSLGGRGGRGGRSHGAEGGGRGRGGQGRGGQGRGLGGGRGRGLGGGRQGGGRRLPLQVTTNAVPANTATANTATANAATAKRVMRCSRCLELGHTSRSLVCKAKLMEKIERERQERELGGRNQEATAAREPELVVLDDDKGQPSSLVTQDQGEEDIGIDEALLALETMGD